MAIIQRFKAAYRAFREGTATWWPTSAGVDPDESDWRRLTGNTARDLSPLQQDRVLDIAYYLYETNPMARAILSLKTDYLVAEGVDVKAENDTVQEVLDRFWNDPDNAMDLRLDRRLEELWLWGEALHPVAINPTDGHVKLATIDVGRIKQVNLDPNNIEKVDEVVLKPPDVSVADGKTYKIIALDEDANSPTFGYRVGEAFFYRVNHVAGASRGRSDLLPLADYLDAHDSFMFNRLEKTAYVGNFMWDVKLQGADERAIRDWLKNNPVPKPGAIRAHNENVEWTAIAPDLKAYDATYDERMARTYILGGARIPEHYFGAGGEVNRATASEMGQPVVKHLSRRQHFVKHMLTEMLDFIIDQAILAGTLPKEVNREFDLFFPELSTKDWAQFGQTILQTAQALLIAQDRNWVDRENASKLFTEIASMLGPTIQPLEEQEIPEMPEQGGGVPGETPEEALALTMNRTALKKVKG